MRAGQIQGEAFVPETGLLNSTVIMQRIRGYGLRDDLTLKREESSIDKLGSINATTDFLLLCKVPGT